MDPNMRKSVLSGIKPTFSEAKEEMLFSKHLVAIIQRASPKQCKVVLTGSIAKGTYLRDSRDIDIFVLFPRDFPKEKFEAEIEKIVKKAFPKTGYQLSYAEHPYARFHVEGRKVDLVPAYLIKKAEERLSAVDRSVLHTKYILKNMNDKQKDDVRLLKKLLKANGLYGAEIRIEGFPGYLCELLILKYISFGRMISEVSKWDLPVVIDLNKHYNAKEAQTVPEKFASAFVMVDPTDKNRNVAAALSNENLRRFIALCRSFKKNPGNIFFSRLPKTFEGKLNSLKTKGHTYTITLPKPDVVDDVLWGQIKKMMKQLQFHLESDGFELPATGLIADESDGKVRIGFAVYDNLLPKTIALEGPPLEMEKHIKQFKKRHKKARFIKRSGRLYAIAKRKIRKPEESIKAFFEDLHKKGKSHLAYSLSGINVHLNEHKSH